MATKRFSPCGTWQVALGVDIGSKVHHHACSTGPVDCVTQHQVAVVPSPPHDAQRSLRHKQAPTETCMQSLTHDPSALGTQHTATAASEDPATQVQAFATQQTDVGQGAYHVQPWAIVQMHEPGLSPASNALGTMIKHMYAHTQT